MTQIIDRRLNGKNKSAVNRQKFIRRYKKHFKHAVEEAVKERSIADIEKGKKVKIPTRDISEPTFGIGSGGTRDTVFPGNEEFTQGDLIPRPENGEGGPGKGEASDSGEGEDDFTFTLSKEEFMDLFFEDLELPDMIKTQIAQTKTYKWVHAGFTNSGSPSNISIIRSMRGAIARRIALQSPHKRSLKELEEELKQLLRYKIDTDEEVITLKAQIKNIKDRIKRIPFIDTFDLRFNNKAKQNIPTTQAVMFCLMDVSGSMGKFEKDIAKRFFILLYLFLTRTYEQIELVFIRHHTAAKEVDEHEFFYSRETGGTVVSSALKTLRDIIQERYPTSEWNIYAAQASDGDNWTNDSPLCRDLLIEQIIPLLQYYAYIEIGEDTPTGNLWEEYEKVANSWSNFAMQKITGPDKIYPVFRKLFKKRGVLK